jgi:glutamate-ammonia-ligase adenylyltransferase
LGFRGLVRVEREAHVAVEIADNGVDLGGAYAHSRHTHQDMTVVDRADVREALNRSADPRAARDALERLVDAHPWLAADLTQDPVLRDALIAVSVASRSLRAALERDPGAVAMLRSDALRGDPAADDILALDGADTVPTVAESGTAIELRRWKHRQLARIAARDLLGLADLRVVARELSEVASASLSVALRLAEPRVPMTVIGMGKLGGNELNYASDVDVIFVHRGDGETAEAERAARAVLRVMSEPTAEGIVFRTDAALRPEGRAGALSRSVDAYVAYWERWARPWELQALIKARPVAGDDELGAAFAERTSPFVWPELLDPDAVREIRAMKARTEEMLRRQGVADRELKRGYGGIRDIEFAVQLLQLVHGRADPNVRSRTTLEALEELARGGYVSLHDANQLDEAYVWLRTVEHRLQLVDEHQTHTIPSDTEARTHLARVLGFRDTPAVSALEAFDDAHRSRQAVVRTIHEKLFFAPLLDTLAGVGALPEGAAEARLAAFGFEDIDQTRNALNELATGLTRRSRVMQQLLPAILGWLSAGPDPDLGLLQLRRLSEGYTRSSTLARRFRETPVAAERACRILSSSRVLGLALHRHPDVVDALADDGFVHNELARSELVEAAVGTLDWRSDEDERRAGLRRFKRRELLRIGTRDTVGNCELSSIGRELAHLGDACIEAVLQSMEPPLPFAVIGLGRLGGCELSYASDIDIVFVYDGKSARDFDEAERLATRLVRAIGETTSEGATFRVDARLRPEGNQGPLARSLDGFGAYYERYGQTWEFQALTRARPVAGSDEVAARFMELIEPFVYRDPMPEDWRREIRRMKARIERERIPPGEDPRFHLKLGRGSLSDIEFTVQLEQLAAGGHDAGLRAASTLAALDALVGSARLDAEDADRLRESYDLCERARNARYLLTGTPGDALPIAGDEAEKLARLLGYAEQPQQRLRDDYRRVTRRARSVVERVFYGRET